MRGASTTAVLVCLARALDARRPPQDRVVDDPWSYAILPRSLRWVARAGRHLQRLERTGVVGFVQARHRAIDEAMVRALEDGAAQVVVLGTGYDSRAWRLSAWLGDRPVFEVDHPDTAAARAERVADLRLLPPVDRRPVEVVFGRDDLGERLTATGFTRGARTFWAWEGVSMYLTEEALRGTLRAIRALSGAGSRVALDVLTRPPPRLDRALYRAGTSALAALGEPITLARTPAETRALLGEEGFSIVEVVDAAALSERYVRDGRPIYPWAYVVEAELE